MTIEFIKRGDIFESGADALVNPVNVVGIMGKGLALAFKKKFPVNFSEYASACHRRQFHVGEVLVINERIYKRGLAIPIWIVNFPTKWYWKDDSKIEWIEQGLESLKEQILLKNIKSVAIPALGCGNGNLEWKDVKEVLKERMTPLKGVRFMIYEPQDDI